MLRRALLVLMVYLATAAQLLAPVAQARALADALQSPSGLAALCIASSQNTGDQADPSGKPHHGADCCVFCPVSFAGLISTDRAADAVTFADPAFQRIHWHNVVASLPEAHIGHHAQARAPPALS